MNKNRKGIDRMIERKRRENFSPGILRHLSHELWPIARKRKYFMDYKCINNFINIIRHPLSAVRRPSTRISFLHSPVTLSLRKCFQNTKNITMVYLSLCMSSQPNHIQVQSRYKLSITPLWCGEKNLTRLCTAKYENKSMLRGIWPGVAGKADTSSSFQLIGSMDHQPVVWHAAPPALYCSGDVKLHKTSRTAGEDGDWARFDSASASLLSKPSHAVHHNWLLSLLVLAARVSFQDFFTMCT